MATYSVVSPSGQTYGPADEPTLAGWAREGRISAQTILLCHETNARFVAPGLASLAPFLGAEVQPGTSQPVAYVSVPAWDGNAALGSMQPLGYANVQTGHLLQTFNVAAVIVLHIVTLGIFTLIHFQLMHDRLPRNRPDDPSAGKAIGFLFIPFFNIYWVFFVQLRLLDRIDEQRRAAGLPDRPLKGLCITALVLAMIPLLNYLSMLILIPVYFGMLQSNINELCRATGRG